MTSRWLSCALVAAGRPEGDELVSLCGSASGTHERNSGSSVPTASQAGQRAKNKLAENLVQKKYRKDTLITCELNK